MRKLLSAILILISLHSNADCVETLKKADETIKSCDLYVGSLEQTVSRYQNVNSQLLTEVNLLKLEIEEKNKWYHKPEYALMIGFVVGTLTYKGVNK